MLNTKALIHYFTGTGNSARASVLVSSELRSAGIDPFIRSITKGKTPYQSSFDLHIFIFPTYSFTMPEIMRRYLKSLPPGRGSRTMIIAIHGEEGYEGSALFAATKILTNRGYHVHLTDNIEFPSSFTQFINPTDSTEQDKIYNQAAQKINVIMQRFINGEESLKPCSFFNRFWTGLVGFLFSTIGRRYMGKLFVVDESCNRCGKCLKICPSGALKMVFRPRWNYKCQACQRCINFCPEKAIQTSCIRPIIMIGSMVLAYFWVKTISISDYSSFSNPFLDGFIYFFLWLISYLVFFYVTDKILFILELIPGIRKLLNHSFTKSFRRYLEPHYNPSNKMRDFQI